MATHIWALVTKVLLLSLQGFCLFVFKNGGSSTPALKIITVPCEKVFLLTEIVTLITFTIVVYKTVTFRLPREKNDSLVSFSLGVFLGEGCQSS